MRGTKRPQNFCQACGYHWYPRGKNVSLRCPNCGSGAVGVVSLPGWIIGVGAVALGVAVVWGALAREQQAPGGDSNRRTAPAPAASREPTPPGLPEPEPPKSVPSEADESPRHREPDLSFTSKLEDDPRQALSEGRSRFEKGRAHFMNSLSGDDENALRQADRFLREASAALTHADPDSSEAAMLRDRIESMLAQTDERVRELDRDADD